MAKKKKETPKYNGRDFLIVEIIKGATKSGVHKDRRKEENKKRCRQKVKEYD